jgi:hypothetical protein
MNGKGIVDSNFGRIAGWNSGSAPSPPYVFVKN